VAGQAGPPDDRVVELGEHADGDKYLYINHLRTPSLQLHAGEGHKAQRHKTDSNFKVFIYITNKK
jgi:hypothetical protein